MSGRPASASNARAYAVVLPSTTMLIRPLQSENASGPMLVTLDGIVTDVSPLQFENVISSMLVTLDGIVTDVRPLQP